MSQASQTKKPNSAAAEMSQQAMDIVINKAATYLGVSSPKEFQKAAIAAVLSNKEVFVSYPTGSGKSLIFQALPIAKGFLTEQTSPLTYHVLVIQPVIALMKDQIKKLSDLGLNVVRLMHAREKDFPGKVTLEEMLSASVILASPEAVLETYRSEMKSSSFSEKLVAVALDESHMIAKWLVFYIHFNLFLQLKLHVKIEFQPRAQRVIVLQLE